MIGFSGPVLCLVTNRKALAPDARTTGDALRALERQLDDAIGAGVDLIQLRERDLDAATLSALARRIVRRTDGTPTRVVVNDRADVAVAAEAHGVHLRSDSAAPSRVRRMAGPEWIVGRSVHHHEDLRGATGCSYVLAGTVFPSVSKNPGTPILGLDGLGALVRASSIPVLAIGGMDPARMALAVAAGAMGAAAISVFFPSGEAPGAMGAARAARECRAAMRDAAAESLGDGPVLP